MGYVTVGIFAIFLNRALLCSEDSLKDENLIEEILEYSSAYEQERLSRIMSSSHLSPNDNDFHFDFADRGGVAFTLTLENARNIVLEVAPALLMQMSMHSMAKIKEGMPQVPGRLCY